jgi:hypothetical protein
MTNIIPIHDTSIPAPDIADRLDEEIDHVWGLIGCLQTISTEYSGDPLSAAHCVWPTFTLTACPQSAAT